MPDIKTRDVVKGTVKAIDKSAVAAERMKDAYIRTKDKAEQGLYSVDNSPNEYAADHITGSAESAVREAVHQFDKQGRRGIRTTKENISKAKEHFRQKKAENGLRRSADTAKKSIRTLERSGKNIKQTAKSTGKVTIKSAKGSVKTAQKTIKTAEQTAKTAIKTTQQAAKVAQKTAQATARGGSRCSCRRQSCHSYRKSGCQSHSPCGQGNYSRNKGADCRHCCRRLDCRCGDFGNLYGRFPCRLVLRHFLRQSGFRSAKHSSGCCRT